MNDFFSLCNLSSLRVKNNFWLRDVGQIHHYCLHRRSIVVGEYSFGKLCESTRSSLGEIQQVSSLLWRQWKQLRKIHLRSEHLRELVHARTPHGNGYVYDVYDKGLSVILTVLEDHQEKILAPAASKIDPQGWYQLEGYTSSSSILVFHVPKEPHYIYAASELRLWYGEDFKNFTDSDNGGRACADVYGLLAWSNLHLVY